MTAASSPVERSVASNDLHRFQALFLAASAWNVAGAIMGLFFLDPLARLAWPGARFLEDPISVQFAMMVFGLIAVLGVGYALVALDPSRNRGLILTAAIGKPLVLAFGIYYSVGVGTAWLLLPAAGVVFFTSSFWWFLFRTRESGWY